MKIQNLPGTRDFYPAEMRQLNYIFSAWKKAAEKYGYAEVEGPMLESVDLWKEKTGELPEQMYNFKDKGDREVTIRPEFTPTLARLVAQKQKELTKPIRWYGIIRCWRYERPQSGRLREFFQFNIDCLGMDSMKADAEIIAVAAEILKELKLTPKEAYVRISNRKLLKGLLAGIGLSEKLIDATVKAIDKKDKMQEKEYLAMLEDYGLSTLQVEQLNDILETNSIAKLEKQKLNEEAAKGLAEIKELFSYLKSYGLEEYCELDLTIIRGLDYYTSTVFEVFDRSKKFRAIAGGGRYDDLVADFGGERCPGIGFGMGDVVLQLFLKERNKLPEHKKELEYYIAPISETVLNEAIGIAQKLRERSNAEIDLYAKNLKKQLYYANSIGAKKVVIIGEKDLKEQKVTIKDMATGKEEKVKISSL